MCEVYRAGNVYVLQVCELYIKPEDEENQPHLCVTLPVSVELPQVLVDGVVLGGETDLQELEEDGDLGNPKS